MKSSRAQSGENSLLAEFFFTPWVNVTWFCAIGNLLFCETKVCLTFHFHRPLIGKFRAPVTPDAITSPGICQNSSKLSVHSSLRVARFPSVVHHFGMNVKKYGIIYKHWKMTEGFLESLVLLSMLKDQGENGTQYVFAMRPVIIDASFQCHNIPFLPASWYISLSSLPPLIPSTWLDVVFWLVLLPWLRPQLELFPFILLAFMLAPISSSDSDSVDPFETCIYTTSLSSIALYTLYINPSNPTKCHVKYV